MEVPETEWMNSGILSEQIDSLVNSFRKAFA